MPFSSLAEIVFFVVVLGGIYFLLKPLQKSVEKFLRKLFRKSPNPGDIIDVTPSANKKESK